MFSNQGLRQTGYLLLQRLTHIGTAPDIELVYRVIYPIRGDVLPTD